MSDKFITNKDLSFVDYEHLTSFKINQVLSLGEETRMAGGPYNIGLESQTSETAFSIQLFDDPTKMGGLVPDNGTYTTKRKFTILYETKESNEEKYARWDNIVFSDNGNGLLLASLTSGTNVYENEVDVSNINSYELHCKLCTGYSSERKIITLAIMSDTHVTDTPHEVKIARCIQWAQENATNLKALVMCGDNVDSPNYIPKFKDWAYHTDSGNLHVSVPIVTTIGNHDTEVPWHGAYGITPANPHLTIQNDYSDLFNGLEWYSWDCEDILRIASVNNLTDYLGTEGGYAGDSMYYNCNPPGDNVLNPDHSGISIPASAQRTWLDSVFDSSHPWKIIICHRSMWAPFDSDPRRLNRLARPAMATAIDKGCSMICQGDIHIGSLSGPWYPTAPDYEEYRDPGSVAAYSMTLLGGYVPRSIDETILPDHDNTVLWASGYVPGGVGTMHIALLQLDSVSDYASLKIFRCSNADPIGEVIYETTITKNPGI